MKNSILLVSDNADDLQFWSQVGSSNSAPIKKETAPEGVRAFLKQNPGALVFWDANPSESQRIIEDTISECAPPSNVFAISDGPLNRQPDLFKPPIFSHHIFRRYKDPAPFIYSRLIKAAFASDPFGIQRYFPEDVEMLKFLVTESNQKQAVIDKLRAYMEARGVSGRLSALGADAADELIMNAIFDAPYSKDKGSYRRNVNRDENFKLSPMEQVEVELACCEDFIGIRVMDHFGSLKRESILNHLAQDYREGEYDMPDSHPGAGLGLHKLNQLAMALLFACKPGVRTDVMVFFGNTKSYREFRLGFSFFCIMDR